MYVAGGFVVNRFFYCCISNDVLLFQRTLCVLAANVCLGLLTAFHLAYLGLMFDSSSTSFDMQQ